MSFVHSVQGEILCSPTDEDEDEVVVGKLGLSYINMADAMENGYVRPVRVFGFRCFDSRVDAVL
jgi:hypothetical protein